MDHKVHKVSAISKTSFGIRDQYTYSFACTASGKSELKKHLLVFEIKKALAPLCALGRLPNSTQTNLINHLKKHYEVHKNLKTEKLILKSRSSTCPARVE